jgi:hypothetical protein
MGMDAKATVFYGYAEPVSLPEDEDGDLDLSMVPEGVTVVKQQDNLFLAIEETIQRFDWDYGAQPLDVDRLGGEDCITAVACRDLLREAASKLDIGMDWDKVGWLVVCDYR